jgi:small subunit ribosomal protein S6
MSVRVEEHAEGPSAQMQKRDDRERGDRDGDRGGDRGGFRGDRGDRGDRGGERRERPAFGDRR